MCVLLVYYPKRLLLSYIILATNNNKSIQKSSVMMKCPICGETFKDGRGLHGHLRFKEGLQGEKLDEVYERAKQMQKTREREESASESPFSFRADHSPTVRRVMEAVVALEQAYEKQNQAASRLKIVESSKPASMNDEYKEAWEKLRWAFRQEDTLAQAEAQRTAHKLRGVVRSLASEMSND